MSSGADLFVVCKQCGSQVSPYVTECPYCGHRLRRRAPKLPREKSLRATGAPRVRRPALGRLRRGEIPGIRGDLPPYATILLVAVSAAAWVALRGGYLGISGILKVAVVGPLHGHWWRLLSSQFAYVGGFSGGVYALACVSTVAVFGWLLERRHGPAVVVALFLGMGVLGGLAAEAVYSHAVLSGANAGALGLLAAWVAPDLRAALARRHYDGDLLGAAAFAAVLLAMPLARTEASWLAGVTGAVVGLTLGCGLARLHPV
jgi:Rhomboid family/zinc-ribbon domain